MAWSPGPGVAHDQHSPVKGTSAALSAEDAALVELGRELQGLSYEFVTVTPETHQRVLSREPRLARDLRDVFGWSRRFDAAALPKRVASLMRRAGVLLDSPAGSESRVRFSTLGGRLLLHSSFPTLGRDAVFFGPDSYRFCAFVARCMTSPLGRVVDVGCGSGAGGLAAAHRAEQVVLSDVNDLALRFARINATLAGIEVETVHSDVLAAVAGPIDAVIANPPYLRDSAHRTYRDGGGAWGEQLSIRICQEALDRLAPKGRLVLYTGAPIVAGRDVLREAVEGLCRRRGADFSYEELDPDVFGDELSAPSYADVERIAAVGLFATLP